MTSSTFVNANDGNIGSFPPNSSARDQENINPAVNNQMTNQFETNTEQKSINQKNDVVFKKEMKNLMNQQPPILPPILPPMTTNSTPRQALSNIPNSSISASSSSPIPQLEPVIRKSPPPENSRPSVPNSNPSSSTFVSPRHPSHSTQRLVTPSKVKFILPFSTFIRVLVSHPLAPAFTTAQQFKSPEDAEIDNSNRINLTESQNEPHVRDMRKKPPYFDSLDSSKIALMFRSDDESDWEEMSQFELFDEHVDNNDEIKETQDLDEEYEEKNSQANDERIQSLRGQQRKRPPREIDEEEKKLTEYNKPKSSPKNQTTRTIKRPAPIKTKPTRTRESPYKKSSSSNSSKTRGSSAVIITGIPFRIFANEVL